MRSTPGKGTRMRLTVRLPLGDPAQVDPGALEQTSASGAGDGSDRRASRRLPTGWQALDGVA